MSLQTIYQTFKDASHGFNFCKELDGKLLMKLQHDLEIEILAAENKGATSKQRIKSIDSYFKKIGLKRPVLGCYTKQVEGYNSFTDTFFLVELKDEDFAGLTLQDAAELGLNYPALDRITNFNNFNGMEYSITFNINEVLNKMKLLKKDEVLTFTSNKNDIVYFRVDVLKMFILSMNLKPSDTITLKTNSYFKPYHFIKENGSRGIILACHPEKEDCNA